MMATLASTGWHSATCMSAAPCSWTPWCVLSWLRGRRGGAVGVRRSGARHPQGQRVHSQGRHMALGQGMPPIKHGQWEVQLCLHSLCTSAAAMEQRMAPCRRLAAHGGRHLSPRSLPCTCGDGAPSAMHAAHACGCVAGGVKACRLTQGLPSHARPAVSRKTCCLMP